MNETLRELLIGKTLCGNANGDKILFTSIDFVAREFEGQTVYMLEISGEAGGYLINPMNPERGAEALPQPVSVTIAQNTEKDAAIQLKSLSRALGLSEADTIDATDATWLERFTEDHPKSVVPLLKEKGLFVKTTLKQNYEKAMKYGESPFYFNPFFVPTREAVTASKVAEIRAKLLAKQGGVVLDGIA